MRVLLDTNLLIDGRLDHPGHEAFVSSLTYAELENGIVAAAGPQERDWPGLRCRVPRQA